MMRRDSERRPMRARVSGRLVGLLAAVALQGGVSDAAPLGTAFTYQGQPFATSAASVTAGSGVSGGALTTSGTIAVAPPGTKETKQ